MKILFQNYATENSTEATYLAQCLSMVDGVDCDLWSNPNVSTYDVLDSYKPDLVATHYRFVTTDLIKYISSNPSSSPELILNVTGATPEEAESIEGLEGSGVKIRLAFTNSTVKEKFKKIQLKGIYPAADIFLTRKPQQPAHPLGILNDGDTDTVTKAVQKNSKYHLLSLEKGDHSDMQTNVGMLHDLYCFYERFVIAGSLPLVTSQIFFDSCLSCHKVDILPDEKSLEGFNNFLSKVFQEPSDTSEDLGQQLKKQILAKHTPFNRAERLMRFLNHDQAVKNLQKLKNDVVKH